MNKGDDGLFTKTSGRCWVDLEHPQLDTLVCKSLRLAGHTKPEATA